MTDFSKCQCGVDKLETYDKNVYVCVNCDGTILNDSLRNKRYQETMKAREAEWFSSKSKWE